ncbi:MAG TPA: S8 family serine peptidase, partial [Propionibacteriaceae bacterium]|nr:S8 family serine peptidase [Propionibacteriaceae bacterium]
MTEGQTRMTHDFARRLSAIAASAALVLSLTSLGHVQAAPQKDVGGPDTSSAIVQLSAPPLATSTAIDRGKSNKINFSGTKTKNVRAQLAAQRNALRSWLKTNAPKAKITGEYDVALNAVAVRLNGTPIATIQKAPNVTHVGYQNTYVPTMSDPDLALINGVEGWAAAGKGSPVDADPSTWAGYGVKVGVIDTGIDVTHPCFDDAGFPDTKQLGNTKFTNNKVIVARVFNNKLNQSGFTAEAIQDHGTHVAGTVACNAYTPAAVSGADIP